MTNASTAATQQMITATFGIAKTVYVNHGRKQYIQIIDSLSIPKEYKKNLKSPEFLETLPEGPFAIDFIDATLPPLTSLKEAKLTSQQITVEKKKELLSKELSIIVAKLGKIDLRKTPITPLDTLSGHHVQITHRKKFGIIKTTELVLSQSYLLSTESTLMLHGNVRAIERPENSKVRRERRSPAFEVATVS